MSQIVGIDIGGTFTDTVVMDGDGRVSTFKSFTTPGRLLDGLLANLRAAAVQQQRPVAELLEDVRRIAHGTTVATNAFIQRRGARVGLLTTRGFEDTLLAQRMMGMTAELSRSEVTDYSRRAVPEPLCPANRIVGVRERVDYAGRVLAPLDEDDVAAAVERFRAQGVEAIAVCFLWAFKNPQNEGRAAELLARLAPDLPVSVSSAVSARIGEYERTATTAVNAFLAPVISQYMTSLGRDLAAEGRVPPVLLLDSSGGLMSAPDAAREPVRLLLSGPAGGMTASELLGRLLEHPDVITFDMGGTSCDVGLVVDGAGLKRTDAVVGKYHLQLPMIDIRAIGAGGGSVAKVVAGQYLQVGPESAGAEPGPASYGRGGTRPTVTDADLVLGILNPDNFLGGRVRLDVDAAVRAIREHVAEPLALEVEEAAAGIKRIVDQQMLDLLRTVTVERGHDPRDFVLYAYGGAGASHAPSFALGLVPRVVVPATHSVHSALGAVASDAFVWSSVSEPVTVRPGASEEDLEELARALTGRYEGLEQQASSQLSAQEIDLESQTLTRMVDACYHRQTKELNVAVPDGAITAATVGEVVKRFENAYTRRYGAEAVPPNVAVELVTFTVEGVGALPRPRMEPGRVGPVEPPERVGRREVFDVEAGTMLPTDIHDGGALPPGTVLDGPAVLEYVDTTVLVGSRQRAEVDAYHNVHITATEGAR